MQTASLRRQIRYTYAECALISMCHRYNVNVSPQKLAEIFAVVRNNFEQTAAEDLFPLSTGPVIRLDSNGERELTAMQWGFLPAWWKPSGKSNSRKAFQRKCFNARSETVHEKPTYRSAFKQHRCLIPALRFEEKSHWFGMADATPFVFAGLWERWSRDGESVESYTMLTTEPAPLVGKVHHRMPVILPDEHAITRWLSPDLTERPALQDLLQPFGESLVECDERA